MANELESFLLLTPSVTFLRITGECSIFDGKRWEKFIQANLPQLNQFEFNIQCQKSDGQTPANLDLILTSYQSSFWIEDKKWFVTIERDEEKIYDFEIFSIPNWKSSYDFDFNEKRISLSTSNQIFPTNKISYSVFRNFNQRSKTN